MFSKNVFVCFPEGRQKVFTLSYDDANIYDKRLVELMRKYHVKGTFNICSGSPRDPETTPDFLGWRLMPLQEAVALYGDDMEIAIHGKKHPHWEKLPTNLAMMDILDDRRNLERATGKIIRGAAYPFGTYNDDAAEILRLSGIAYCRTIEDAGSIRTLPEAFLRWQPTCHHNDPKLMDYAREFVEDPKNALRMYNTYLFYVWGHSFEFVRNDNWHVIEELLAYVGGRDDIWYATNLEIADYFTAGKKLIYDIEETQVYNPTATSLWIRVQVRGQTERPILKIAPGETVKLP